MATEAAPAALPVETARRQEEQVGDQLGDQHVLCPCMYNHGQGHTRPSPSFPGC